MNWCTDKSSISSLVVTISQLSIFFDAIVCVQPPSFGFFFEYLKSDILFFSMARVDWLISSGAISTNASGGAAASGGLSSSPVVADAVSTWVSTWLLFDSHLHQPNIWLEQLHWAILPFQWLDILHRNSKCHFYLNWMPKKMQRLWSIPWCSMGFSLLLLELPVRFPRFHLLCSCSSVFAVCSYEDLRRCRPRCCTEFLPQ